MSLKRSISGVTSLIRHTPTGGKEKRHLLGGSVMPVNMEPTMTYSEYLKTVSWKEKRNSALRVAGHKCQTCNDDKNLHVHHRQYPKVLGQEPIQDLIVLCEKCHKLFHVHRSVGRVKIQKIGRITPTRKKYHYWVKTPDDGELRAICNPQLIYNIDHIFAPDNTNVLCKVCKLQLDKYKG